jgi:FAD/FMN-containing dehydrogenase
MIFVYLTAITDEQPKHDAAELWRRKFWEEMTALGGKVVPLAFPARGEDIWQKHFGQTWSDLRKAKQRYDPQGIMTPQQRIFS